MATPFVFAITGALYFDPTSVLVGGTRLQEIEAQTFTISLPSSVIIRRTGIGVNSGFVSRRGRSEPAVLTIPLREQSPDAMRVLMDHLTSDGNAFDTFGGVGQMRIYTGFGVVVRSGDGDKYFYAPSMRLSTGTDQSLAFSREAPLLASNTLVLIANSVPGFKSWMYDTAVNIDAHYFPEEPGEPEEPLN